MVLSSWVFETVKDQDSTTSLDNLFQRSAALLVLSIQGNSDTMRVFVPVENAANVLLWM